MTIRIWRGVGVAVLWILWPACLLAIMFAGRGSCVAGGECYYLPSRAQEWIFVLFWIGPAGVATAAWVRWRQHRDQSSERPAI